MIGTPTLYETIGAYDGLAFQAFFRAKTYMVPLVLFALGLILIFVRGRSLKDPEDAAWNKVKYAFFTGLLVLLLSCMDALLTLTLLDKGAHEANYLMAQLLAIGDKPVSSIGPACWRSSAATSRSSSVG